MANLKFPLRTSCHVHKNRTCNPKTNSSGLGYCWCRGIKKYFLKVVKFVDWKKNRLYVQEGGRYLNFICQNSDNSDFHNSIVGESKQMFTVALKTTYVLMSLPHCVLFFMFKSVKSIKNTDVDDWYPAPTHVTM